MHHFCTKALQRQRRILRRAHIMRVQILWEVRIWLGDGGTTDLKDLDVLVRGIVG